MGSDRESLIRERAYAIWLAEGRPAGRQEAHWQRAEQEIGAQEIGAQEAARGSAVPADTAAPTQAPAQSRGKAKPRAARNAAGPVRRGRGVAS